MLTRLHGRREAEMLKAILDHIPVMISSYDAAGKLTYANREWQRALGWTLEEAQQIDILAAVYPEPEARGEVLDFIRRAEERWTDFQVRARDGRMIDTTWARFAFGDGSSIGFGVDITERKRAEQVRAELAERFITLFRVAPVPLAISTFADGCFMDVNDRWLELFGYRREEVVGRTEQELELLLDSTALARAIDSTRANGHLRDFELQVRCKSGEVRDLLVSAILAELPGQPATWLSTQLDITARKNADAERTRLLESQVESRAIAEAALKRLHDIHAITDVALSFLDLDDLLRELLKRLRQTLDVEIASVRLIDETRNELHVRAIDGIALELIAGFGLPLSAVDLRQPWMSNDVQPPPPGSETGTLGSGRPWTCRFVRG